MAYPRGHYEDYDADVEMHPGYQKAKQRSDLGKEREPSIVPSSEPAPATQDGQLTLYDEEKSYAEWQRGEAEYRRRHEHDSRPVIKPHGEYHDVQQQYHPHDARRDSHSREHTRPHPHDGALAGTLLGGGAGAFLGHELVHGSLGTIGGAVVGALAGRSLEGYDERKRRQREDERRRIRHEYDSSNYDPRGSSRSSNFYDSYHPSPAGSIHAGRYPSMPSRQRQPGQHPPRRQRRPPSSSSDSYTSDD